MIALVALALAFVAYAVVINIVGTATPTRLHVAPPPQVNL